MQMDKIVIIADDLTGAADTGVQFCHFFEETILLPYHRLAHGYEAMSPSTSRALSIYTSSRALGAHAASDRVASVGRQLSTSPSTWIYKKVDSCLRGNLGAETEALMNELGFELSFIAPAFPEMGRTTANDIHQVHGTPVSETEVLRDPVTPVTESRLSRNVAAQSRYPVGHVALHFLEADETGLENEIERLRRRGVRHVVFDATSQEHLDRIACLVFSSARRILPVGSAGLAASLGRLLPQKPALKGHVRSVSENRGHLLVCGTASQVTKLQIKTLTETYPYEEIILEAAILADHHQRDAVLNRASSVRSKLCQKSVVVRIDWQPNNYDALKPTDRMRMAEFIARGLELFVGSVLKGAEPAFVFATGGDTADAVLRAVDARGIRIFGQIVTGMVQGTVLGGPMDGLPMVTKAGAFGNKDALVVLHETWQGARRI
ncbi:MAG: four-carbon acid sugar kinase family protein [Desulfobacterales bacterium]|nr:MAG: four-carbon acid sugar kinase family protein [Desulfobacterales bacterium]